MIFNEFNVVESINGLGTRSSLAAAQHLKPIYIAHKKLIETPCLKQ